MPSDRQYELVYIITPDSADAEVEALQKEIGELVTELGGSVENTDLWGRRKLAYEIGRHREGIYVVQLLSGPGEMISELGRRLRVQDKVLRYLTVRVDEDLRKVRRAAEKKKATVQRRRAARGKPPLPDGDDAPAAPPAGAAAPPPAGPPAADTPAADTPAADTPAADTPAADTPAADTPAADTPAADTPAADTPAADTPAADVGATDAPEKTSEVQE